MMQNILYFIKLFTLGYFDMYAFAPIFTSVTIFFRSKVKLTVEISAYTYIY